MKSDMYYYPYYDNKRLASLSYRLSNATAEEITYLEHRESYALYDNSHFNVSLLIAKIIQNLEFKTLSKATFEEFVEKYNKGNATQIKIGDLVNRAWIRFINDEVILPNVISRYIGLIIFYENRGEEQAISIELIKEIEFFKLLYITYYKDIPPLISKDQVNEIITEHPGAIIERLVEKNLLKESADKDFYQLSEQNEYCRFLRNEITVQLWLAIVERDHSEKNFKRFITLIWKAHLWPDDLKQLLTRKSLETLSRLAIDYLSKEEDLINSDIEVRKSFFDNPQYNHVKADSIAPDFTFKAERIDDLIDETKNLTWHHPQIIEMQTSRSIYDLTLRLIILSNTNERNPFQSVLDLLKDTTKPFLVYTLADLLEDRYTQVIPFALTDPKLASFGLEMMHNIKINDESCSDHTNNETKFREKTQIKNQFWFEGFSEILSRVSKHLLNDEDDGKILGVAMRSLAEKVFTFNNNNYQYSLDSHQGNRKLYEQTLKMISEYRDESNYFNSAGSVKPRIFPDLLPKLFKELDRRSKLLPHTEFLKLETGLIDLAVEYLRISNIPLAKNEFPTATVSSLEDLRQKITEFVFNKLLYYFTTVEMEVYSYDGINQVRKVKRGINEFGLEIVDWGYLYLYFDRYSLIKRLDNALTESIVFNTLTEEGKYDDLNKEQGEKIRAYLKILVLAHITITKEEQRKEFDNNEKKRTLIALEDIIKDYSFRYSKDKIFDKRIDVFDEMIFWFNNDIYRQPLTKLLYQAVNKFQTTNQLEFIETLFKDSNDVGRMISIVNNIDSIEVKKFIAKKIENVNIEEYINSRMTTTELEAALIEAINSENHFELAEPLLNRIESHLKKVNSGDLASSDFFFSIRLLLLYKRRDLEALQNIELPNSKAYGKSIADSQKKKSYYLALFKLNYLQDYEGAISILEVLASQDEKNVDYSFNLYKARTLQTVVEENEVK